MGASNHGATMNRPKPKVIPGKKYTIKWICFEMCICSDTLRKYTNLGVIAPIRISCREIYYLGSEVLILHDYLVNKHKRKNKHKRHD